ncbi:replicative DNA helicase [Caballeronia arationis]|uniref:LAGLIDADG family homing endonuclease n=1 Tax=Caballeronia arationis TaxID=1777142 RepID=UPI00074CB431|nr:LAGLIDADG family homing endonuclease [Caballeronia arationis]SAK58981.1 replicative DNA helicase [Caballeronia arationis]
MFSALQRLIGLIRVEESGDLIKVSGLPGDSVAKTIFEVWGTSKIVDNMFTKVTPSDVVFNRFFAPDVVYAFTRIVNEKKKGHNIRALKKVVEGIYEHTWMKTTIIKHPDILDKSQLSQLKWSPLEHQDGFFAWFNEMVPRFGLRGAMLGAGPGTGKSLALDALIKTPGGWSTMGAMRVGTEVVTPKGTVTTVTGVYPQGTIDMYRITFSDGRSVEASADHLWKVHLRHERRKGYWHVRTTKEIMESTSFADMRAYIPLIEAEDGPAVDLPIDPYLLGVILGDGCISGKGRVVITKPEEFIREKVRSRLDVDMRVGEWIDNGKSFALNGAYEGEGKRANSLSVKIRKVGLAGKRAHEKFVPDEYLLGNRQQRLDLLNGLLDSDGTSELTGGASFTSTSLDLAEAVQYLVRSLGGMASLRIKRKQFTYRGEKDYGRTCFTISIRHKYPEDLFTLPRKKERLNNSNQYCENLKLRIDSIEYVGQKPAQCIAVSDEERLYVTDDFIVTHNTYMGIALGLQLHADVVIIVCPSRAVKKVWEETIVTQFKRPQPYWHSKMGTPPKPKQKYYIVHYDSPESLQRFMEFAKTQSWHKPVILLDESHGLNEESALRTQLFIDLCALTRCQFVLWESGTPVKAIGGEMAPLFRTIDPLFDPDAQARFRAIYGKASARANDILSHRLGKVTYKVDSNNVVKISVHHPESKIKIPNGDQYTLASIRSEMRSFIDERIKHYTSNMRMYERMFENALSYFYKTLVTSEQKDAFKTYEKNIKLIRKGYDPSLMKDAATYCNNYEKKVIIPALPKDLKGDFKTSKSVVKYHKLKVQGEALGRILGRKRAQCVIDMIPYMGLEQKIDTGLKKTLMFTSYVTAVDAAADYLKQRGYGPLRVYGETNNELAQMVTEFGKNEDANPMIATYQSLSSAVPLVMANTMVMFNSPFRSFEYDQAVARCKRLGQDEDVYVYDIVLDTGEEPNISSRTIDIMHWSREQVDEILGFENTQLIAAEAMQDMSPVEQHSYKVATEQIVEQEFEEEMAALEGLNVAEVSERRDPAWAHWATSFGYGEIEIV